MKFNNERITELKEEIPELKPYPNQIIQEALNQNIGLKPISDLPLIEAQLVRIKDPASVDVELATNLFDAGVIEYLEPDYIVNANAVPNDSSYSSLWGLRNFGQSGGTPNIDINAENAWSISTGNRNVVVAVIDTGIDYTHPDLAANMWRNPGEIAGNGRDDDANGYVDDVYGINTITNSGNLLDDNSHGTHCAGTIGAVGNNSFGVVGVNWNVSIMALKFLSSSGSGSTSNAIKAINYAVIMKNRGVNLRVLSNSWGGGGYSVALESAIASANNAGILFVAAAGNSAVNTDSIAHYPSSYANSNVISVAAVDRYGTLAWFSNYGVTTVDFAAPGVSILSTVPGGAYSSYSGTSMAAPHVRGVLALLYSRQADLSPLEAKNILLSTVRPIAGLNGRMVSPGIVNAYAALNALALGRPDLEAISDQSMSRSVDTLSLPLTAHAPNGGAITFSVTVSDPLARAYQLDQSNHFFFHVDYYQNSRGQNEKYFMGNGGSYWYFLLPNGELHRWDNNSLATSPLVARLSTYFYEDPSRLFNVPSAGNTPAVSASFSGTNLILDPAAHFYGNAFIAVTASNGTLTDETTFTLSVIDRPPTLGTLSNQNFSWRQDSLTLPLSVSDPDGDNVNVSVRVDDIMSDAYQQDQLYHFFFNVSYWEGSRGQGEKYFMGDNGLNWYSIWYFLLPNGELHRWDGVGVATSPLVTKLGTYFFEDPSRLFNVAPPGAAPAIALSWSGNNLTIDPPNGFSGIFQIAVTASDGSLSDTKRFTVTLSNHAPVLAAISDQTMGTGDDTLTLPISASDLDADTLSFSASVASGMGEAYAQDQAHHFFFQVSYYEGSRGQGEKYFMGDNGRNWYFLLPNGELHRWDGASVATSPLVIKLGTYFYEDPSRLFQVASPTVLPPVNASISGSNVIIDPANTFTGIFLVTVTANDGSLSDRKSFLVTVSNQAPVLASIADQTMTSATDSITVPISASDPDGDTFTLSAAVQDATAEAYAQDQAHNFFFHVSYYEGSRGQGEKYFLGDNGQKWYFLLPSGDLHRWDDQSVASSPFITRLGSYFYDDPRRLFDVLRPSTAAVASATISGNSVIVNPVDGFSGSLVVTVFASDSRLSTQKAFVVTVTDAGQLDADGDGVSDKKEVQEGTDPNDAGSFIPNLTSPIYTLWNSFLRMVNILELVNPSDGPVNVTVSLYAIDGSLAHQTNVSVPGRGQFDLILNDMAGFVRDSYGIVKIEFQGLIDGRLFYYRPTPDHQEYEFAFGIPLSNANFGRTAVGFNTFQPSSNSSEANNVVANWLTLVNLAETEKFFTIKSYAQDGTLLTSRKVSVPAFGRQDVDGGHGLAGPGVVGEHSIEPEDSTAPYIAQLIRYGANASAGAPANSYSFAFPLVAKAGNGQPLHMPISRQFGENNWVEVINTLGKDVPVTVEFRGEDGSLLHEEALTLPPFAQQHFSSSTYLASGRTGVATVHPALPNSIIAESMFYFRDSSTGSIQAMYGSQAREALGQALFGSYNRFIGMDNWLRVENTSDKEISASLTVNSPTASAETTLAIPAFGSQILALHDASKFHASPDSYGVVVLRTEQTSGILVDLLRVRPVGNTIDFAAPTLLR